MPNSEPALRFLFQLFFPPPPASGRKHTLIDRLIELRDTRESFLSDDEYRQIRSQCLDELATRISMPIMQLAFCTIGVSVGIAMSAYMIAGNIPRLAWVGAPPFAVFILSGWRLYGDYVRKRDLTKTDRLAAVDELTSSNLISIEEATLLRARIQDLFQQEGVEN